VAYTTVPIVIHSSFTNSQISVIAEIWSTQSVTIVKGVHAKATLAQKHSNAKIVRSWDVIFVILGLKHITTSTMIIFTDQSARCASLKLRHAHVKKSSRTHNATVVENSFAHTILATYAQKKSKALKNTFWCLKSFTALTVRIAIAMIVEKQKTSFDVLSATHQLVSSATMFTNGMRFTSVRLTDMRN